MPLPKRAQVLAVLLVIHCWVGAIVTDAAAGDIATSDSTPDNNPYHALGWVPNALLGDHEPHSLCCGRYLRHGFEPYDGPGVLLQSNSFEENQSHGSFQGQVSLRDSRSLLRSEGLLYNKDQQLLELQETGNLYSGQLALSVASGRYEVEARELRGEGVGFAVRERHLRGDAASVYYELETNQINFKRANLSYCPPGDHAWSLGASSLRLDFQKERGYAYNMLFKLGPVPILYAPFYTFPMHDRRESGLLDPKIWQSSRHGWVYHQPYYFNLAPDYDATLYATTMSNHGLMSSVEARRLSAYGLGFVGYSHLESDSNASLEQLDSRRRSYLTLRQGGSLRDSSLAYQLRWDEVSDLQQLEQVPNIFGAGGGDTVPREAGLSYDSRSWSFYAAWEDYQLATDDLAADDYPYAYLPRLGFTFGGQTGFSYRLGYIKFDRDNRDLLSSSQLASGAGLHGERNNQRLGYAWAQRRSWGFSELRLATYQQSYRLLASGSLPSRSDNYYRQLELDSGLIFTRALRAGGNQSLEPRVYYTHTPFVDQNQLPDIDSAASSASLSNIFQPNSFSGGDRFEDADRFSLGLRSETRNGAGQLTWLGELGRAYYLQPRRVTLEPNDSAQQQSFANRAAQSPLFARLSYYPNDAWRFVLNGSWHQNYSTPLNQSLSANYLDSQANKLTLTYSRSLDPDDESVEQQSDLSLVRKLGERWRFFGRWRYDLEQRQEQQLLRGLEYTSCCWWIRLGAYTELDEDDDQRQYDRGWALQFNFTGLTAFNYRRDRENNQQLKADDLENMFRDIPGL